MQTERDTHTETETFLQEETHTPESKIRTHTEGKNLKQGERDPHFHTERDTQTLRERHTLRQKPSSRKRHTLLRARYAHTLRERNLNKESETHTYTLRETHKH